MKVIVCVKQVRYVYHPIAIDPLTGDIDPEKTVSMLNPFDEFAVEEAMGIKDIFPESEVTVLTVGSSAAEEGLRYAFAHGADKMVRIDCETNDPWTISLALAEAIKSLQYDIVLCGEKAIDTNDNQVGSFVAEFLDIGQVSAIVRLEVFPEAKKAVAERYLGKGDRELIECDLPALFTVHRSSVDPRYPTLGSRLRAEREAVERIDITALDIDSEDKPDLSQFTVLTPPRRKPKKVFTPDSHLSASERRRLAMSGGAVNKKKDVLRGTPDEIASRLADILMEEKIV